MKFLIIFGPPAVGKMAVGFELARITGFKVFHNHMTIEPLIRIFPHGSPHFNRLDKMFRFSIFKEAAISDLKGLIFTVVWALDLDSDREYFDEIMNIFSAQNIECSFVELEADQDIRLERNKTPLRLEEKPSKKELQWSEDMVLKMDQKYRMNSTADHPFNYSSNYLKINNTHLTALEAAQQIKEYFNFELKKIK